MDRMTDNQDAYMNTILTSLSETSGVYFFLWNLDTDMYYISPTAREKFAIPPSPILDPHNVWAGVVHPADVAESTRLFQEIHSGKRREFSLEYRLITRKGEKVWVNTRCKALRDADGKVHQLLGSVMEIDQTVRADRLTGLLNQTQLGIDAAKDYRKAKYGFIVIFGVDNFKLVNERHGRHVGDELLRRVAESVEENLASNRRVYRLAGDCFGVNLLNVDRQAVERFYDAVRLRLQDTVREMRPSLNCSLSAGAAAFPSDSRDFGELYQYAESALHSAKRSGKNNLMFFSRREYDRYLNELALREDLQRSVRAGLEGFELYYQPQISAVDGCITGAEALLRWNSPEQGRVGPDTFVPLLENMGLICQVGGWVVDTALDQCARWRRIIPDFCMSVNISYHQLEQNDVTSSVQAALKRNNLPGEAVLLELTESAQLRDYQHFNRTLEHLNNLGVMVAIDDFGTGYSSLGYFKELRVNQIKIDRSFVTRIRDSAYDYKLVQFVTELAHDVGMDVCVEGVETEDEAKVLVPLSPNRFQGYYFGHPVPAEEFKEKFLDNWRNPMAAETNVPAAGA